MTDDTKRIDVEDETIRLLLRKFARLDADCADAQATVDALKVEFDVANRDATTLYNRRASVARAIVELSDIAYDARPARDMVRDALKTLRAQQSAYPSDRGEVLA